MEMLMTMNKKQIAELTEANIRMNEKITSLETLVMLEGWKVCA